LPERFPYIRRAVAPGDAGLSPYLPIDLLLGPRRISESALVDSGAAVNVLPFDVGLRLGAVWDEQTTRCN